MEEDVGKAHDAQDPSGRIRLAVQTLYDRDIAVQRNGQIGERQPHDRAARQSSEDIRARYALPGPCRVGESGASRQASPAASRVSSSRTQRYSVARTASSLRASGPAQDEAGTGAASAASIVKNSMSSPPFSAAA